MPTIEIDRVRRQAPDGSLYVSAADAFAPGAAALTGYDPSPDIATTTVQSAVVDSHRFNLAGAQTVLSLGITVLPTATDTFTIAGEVFEYVDMTAVPPVVTAAANIGIPLAAGAGALEATRVNTIAALNGTAGVTGIEDGAGNPAENIAITSTFFAFRDPGTLEVIRLAWADAVGGRPIHFEGSAIAPWGAISETFANPGNVWLRGETDISDGKVAKLRDVREIVGQVISGTGTIAGGGTLTVAVGAAFNGSPVLATYAAAGGAAVLYGAVAAGDLVITGTAGVDVHWLVDGR
jgi:hypothetical protein